MTSRGTGLKHQRKCVPEKNPRARCHTEDRQPLTLHFLPLVLTQAPRVSGTCWSRSLVRYVWIRKCRCSWPDIPSGYSGANSHHAIAHSDRNRSNCAWTRNKLQRTPPLFGGCTRGQSASDRLSAVLLCHGLRADDRCPVGAGGLPFSPKY